MILLLRINSSVISSFSETDQDFLKIWRIRTAGGLKTSIPIGTTIMFLTRPVHKNDNLACMLTVMFGVVDFQYTIPLGYDLFSWNLRQRNENTRK